MFSSTSISDDSTVQTAFLMQKSDILVSNSTRYLIMDFIGEGSFGKVAKCLNLTTCNTEAVKIHKNSKENIQKEVEMLEAIKGLDPEKNNIVRFMESFRIKNLSCLAFEMLDKSLNDLMSERRLLPLSLNEIRPVIHQLLVAFDALKDIGVLHTDLKPDNIMLVNHKDQPYKVKLIDFGLARPVSHLKVGMTMQARSYRAPEVMLGLPLSEAVDMWGVGCVTAFLYFGMHLFPGNCEYHRMKSMVQLLGQPEDHLLSAGIHSLRYFGKEEGSSSPGWRLKSPEEYRKDAGVIPKVAQRFDGKNLKDAVQEGFKKRDALAYEDLMAFSSLLKSFLHLDPTKRITPKQALKHPFFTMTHLVNQRDTNSYAGEAYQLMAVCRMQCSDGAGDCLTHSKIDMESDSRVFKTYLQRDSSSASVCENDSLTESFSCYDGDIESVSDESSDMDSYTARRYGPRSSSGYDADIESDPATMGAHERDVFIITQRDPSTASLWEEDEFTENFSGRNEATERDVFIETQRDPSPASLCEEDELSEYFSCRSEATERAVFIETQRDPSPAGLCKEDELSEYFSCRSEATERAVFIEMQRDPSPASLCKEAEITGSHSTSNSEEDSSEPSRPFQVQKNDVLFSNSTSYQVIDFIGEGCFGKVAKCLDLTTNKSVAVKIHIENDENDIKHEVKMLEAIRTLDPEKNNITRFLESFRFNNLSCLAFEILDRSLLDLMFERDLMPMRLNEIRPVVHQLLVAFDALKGINMVHTDLKPDNIMLVNHKDQPYRVKLIDFGLARPVSQLKVGDIVQPTECRAPEVMLGLRLSEAIDMWGVGYVMAFLCFGHFICCAPCKYDVMKFMVQLQGLPEDHILNAGIYSFKYFSRVEGSSSPGWRLNSPEEYKKATGLEPWLLCNFFEEFRNLEEAVKKCQRSQEGLENEDAMAFLSLLRSCLHLDPSKRLSPKQALKHPFITMIHLVNEKDTNSYAGEAHQLMAVCFTCHSDEPGDPGI